MPAQVLVMVTALRLLAALGFCGLLLLSTAGATATGGAFGAPAAQCRVAIKQAEDRYAIPESFLSAIGRVESGRPDAISGAVEPWPWTVNAEGAGSFYATKAEAVAAVAALQARGVHSIDVGCLQINLSQHPEAFATLAQAFDPQYNAAFAGAFLSGLHQQTGSWPRAAAAYHSQTPGLGTPYQQRVLAEWALPEGAPLVHKSQRKTAAPQQLVAALQSASPSVQQAFGREAPPIAPRAALKAVTGRSLAAYRAAAIHR